MSFLKYIISSILSVSGAVDGWVPIEKVPQAKEQVEEQDSSIWVLFSKDLGSEKISVRLPADPIYRYTEDGAFQITSERDGEVFVLTVQKEGPAIEGARLYPLEDQWMHEHFVRTAHHLLHFQTLSDQPGSLRHREFISSIIVY